MVDASLPGHVAARRRDGRHEVLLHRALALIGEDRVEIRGARSAVALPLLGVALSAVAGAFIAIQAGDLPFPLLVALLLFALLAFPVSVMALVGAVAGADVVADGRKRSITWQQGYLGMGVGTRELVPFEKIERLAVTIEGADADRWRGERDALRQFALVLVKRSGRRLTLARVPVPAAGQTDGMDRTLAVGNAIAALAGVEVELPDGWELVELSEEEAAAGAHRG